MSDANEAPARWTGKLLGGHYRVGRHLDEGAMAPGRIAFVATQTLSALAAAHAAHIVHRDLKPDNVFLTAMAGVGDVVKLLDFGIAKLTDGTEEHRLTRTGAVMGTPTY